MFEKAVDIESMVKSILATELRYKGRRNVRGQ